MLSDAFFVLRVPDALKPLHHVVHLPLVHVSASPFRLEDTTRRIVAGVGRSIGSWYRVFETPPINLGSWRAVDVLSQT